MSTSWSVALGSVAQAGKSRHLALGAALLLAGCATETATTPPAAGPPDLVEVTFRTDPMTGKTEGPFDTASGKPVETHIGDDGIMRVVIDPVTYQPKLLSKQAGNGRPRNETHASPDFRRGGHGGGRISAARTCPAPTPSPGAGSIASGITPVRYGAPTPGSSRLTASVPVLPPKAAPMVESPAGAPVPPAPAQMAPAVAKVTPYTPPVFSPPVPGRKPAQGQTQTVETPAPASPATAPAGGSNRRRRKARLYSPWLYGIVPITPFGAAPPQPPAPASSRRRNP